MRTPKLRNIFTSKFLRSFSLGAVAIISLLGASSCFTGVESTKKITLSKEDKKAIMPSEEDLFFQPVAGTPVTQWEIGRPFIAADNKALMIFEQQGLPLDMDEVGLGGKKLTFAGADQRIAPDGSHSLVLLFRDGDNLYRYNTEKNVNVAAEEVHSDQVPMLIDCAMIDSARKLLNGKRLWTRSPLWYDSVGNRIPGRKFVPVTINSVESGNLVFPVKLGFKTDDGEQAWAFMNFGNSATESRAFANLFYLNDYRKNFPAISDEVWNLICEGKIATGMSKLECKLSLGNPSEVDAGHDYSQTLDLWHYPDGAILWFEDGVLTRFRR